MFAFSIYFCALIKNDKHIVITLYNPHNQKNIKFKAHEKSCHFIYRNSRLD